MIGSIPFSVPAKFATGIADGSLLRLGTIIKDASNGQILGHLQETGLAQELVSSAMSIPFSPISAVSAIGANLQLAAITKMIAAMQMLQFANLGATLVGIGVSASGFKEMNTRFNQLELQITTFSGNMGYHFRDLEARSLRAHQSHVRSLLDEAELARSFSNSQGEWVRVSHTLAEEAGFYRGEVEHLLSLPEFDDVAFCTLVQLYTICNAARIKCLMLADELLAARDISQATAIQYNLIFDPLSPIALAKKSIQFFGKKDSPYDHLLRQKLTETNQLVSCIRDAQDAASTRPMLVDALIAKGISGRAFVQRLESEKEQPILCLDV